MDRRKHSPHFKHALVEKIKNGGDIKALAKEHALNPSMVSRWVYEKGGKRKPQPHAKGSSTAIVAVPVANGGNVAEAQHAIRDATVLLRKAKSELMRGIRAGTIDDLDPAHLLSLLALQSLQGN